MTNSALKLLFLVTIFSFITFLLSFIVGNAIWFRYLIFWILVVFLLFLIVFSAFYGPSKFKYQLSDWDDRSKFHELDYDNSKYSVVLDTHSHTRASDGKLTVEQNIKFHQSVGFNAAVITDHNTLKNLSEVLEMQKKYEKEFVVIPGVEYTTLRIHMCLIGITEWDCKNIPLMPTNEDIRVTIKKVHDLGGVVSVCHFPWSTWAQYGTGKPRMTTHPTREQLLEWGVDLIECANWDDDISVIDYESYDFASKHANISPCTGTDMHEPFKNPLCGWTLLNAKKFSQEAIMEELRNHRTEVLLKPEGAIYPIKHKRNWLYTIFRPLMMIGKSFEEFFFYDEESKIDIAGLSSWLSYFFGFFILSEMIRYVGI
jgi:hypothetical protein